MVNLFGMMVVIFVVNMTIVICIVKLEYDGRNNYYEQQNLAAGKERWINRAIRHARGSAFWMRQRG